MLSELDLKGAIKKKRENQMTNNVSAQTLPVILTVITLCSRWWYYGEKGKHPGLTLIILGYWVNKVKGTCVLEPVLLFNQGSHITQLC